MKLEIFEFSVPIAEAGAIHNVIQSWRWRWLLSYLTAVIEDASHAEWFLIRLFINAFE